MKDDEDNRGKEDKDNMMYAYSSGVEGKTVRITGGKRVKIM